MKLSRSVLRTTQILKYLSRKNEGMTISELSQALDIPLTTVHDIVTTLYATHFIRKNGKRYLIGSLAKEVGDAYEQEKDLCDIALECIKPVADRTQLAGAFVLLKGYTLDFVLQYQPKGTIISPGANAGIINLHASASGKSLVAFSTPVRQQKLIESIDYTPYTAKTITNEKDYLAELDKVRLQGYAVDKEEFHRFLTCVSAPVWSKGELIGTVTLSGLHILNDDMSTVAKEVKLIAAEISQNLS